MNDDIDKTLQTDRGKKHARNHEEDYIVQSMHQKMNYFCTKSTNTRISASNALRYITLAKIESRKGTSEAFTLYWKNHV